jgi:hypothetical protein
LPLKENCGITTISGCVKILAGKPVLNASTRNAKGDRDENNSTTIFLS